METITSMPSPNLKIIAALYLISPLLMILAFFVARKAISKENKLKVLFLRLVELSAIVAFIFNTICLTTWQTDSGGFFETHLPDFGLFYLLKTLLALIGLGVFFAIENYNFSLFSFGSDLSFGTRGLRFVPEDINPKTKFIYTFLLIALLYSVPGINALMFNTVGRVIFRNPDSAELILKNRLIIQAIWSIPVLIVAIDFIYNLINALKARQ
ncbi:MAG: hypothetical protein V1674_04210 [Candidatus Omnitrophota bacterium]